MPVIGRTAATIGVPWTRLLRAAWSTNPPSQARISGIRPVNRVFRNVPDRTMTAGSSQSPTPLRFSVN